MMLKHHNQKRKKEFMKYNPKEINIQLCQIIKKLKDNQKQKSY
jgi:hypothetical protein